MQTETNVSNGLNYRSEPDEDSGSAVENGREYSIEELIAISDKLVSDKANLDQQIEERLARLGLSRAGSGVPAKKRGRKPGPKPVSGNGGGSQPFFDATVKVNGVTSRPRVAKPSFASAQSAQLAKGLLDYLIERKENNEPGASMEQITSEFTSDTKVSIRRALKKLTENGQVRTEGQKRGTKYFARRNA